MPARAEPDVSVRAYAWNLVGLCFRLSQVAGRKKLELFMNAGKVGFRGC